ncbi:Bax inhibitor-1/YccA family protein [soil metagenome]
MAAYSSNPAFNRSPAFSNVAAVAKKLETPTPAQLDEQFGRPSATPADTGRMTYQDTAVKTVIAFAVLVAGAAIGWNVPGIWVVGALVGFVLAMVNIFKKKISPALILAYAAFEGLFVGGISQAYQGIADGIVPQAVFTTLAIVGITLALFASGKVRASARATKIFLVAMVGVIAYSLVNVVLMFTGVSTGMFGLDSVTIGNTGIPLGVVVGILMVLLAAYSLVLDFDAIQQGVRRGAPAVYAWQGAFGIMVTVVWLYLTILRMIGLVRTN